MYEKHNREMARINKQLNDIHTAAKAKAVGLGTLENQMADFQKRIKNPNPEKWFMLTNISFYEINRKAVTEMNLFY